MKSLSVKKNIANIHTFNFPKESPSIDINSLAILKEEGIAFISTPKTVYYVTIETEEIVNVNELVILEEELTQSLHKYASVDAVATKDNGFILVVTTKLENLDSSSDAPKSMVVFNYLQFGEDNKLIRIDFKEFQTKKPALFVRSFTSPTKTFFAVFSVDTDEISCFSFRNLEDGMVVFEKINKITDSLPEIRSKDKMNGSMVRINQFFHNSKRFFCFGSLDGKVRLTVFDMETKKVKKVDKKRFDSPIGDLKFFLISRGNVGVVHPLVARINEMIFTENNSDDDEEEEEGEEGVVIVKNRLANLRKVNLVVGESMGRVYVFWDVEKNGLKNYSLIFDNNDSVLAVYPFDVNGNGLREILVGTYSQKLMIFKFDEIKAFNFEFVDSYQFDSPVNSLGSLDFTKDGTEELVICSKNCFTIFQQKMNRLQETLNRKYEKFLQLEKHFQKNKE